MIFPDANLAAQFEHAPDGRFGALAQRLGEVDLRLEIEKGVCAFSSVFIFMKRHSAQAQRSVGPGNEEFARNFLPQSVEHAGFGHDDDFLGG